MRLIQKFCGLLTGVSGATLAAALAAAPAHAIVFRPDVGNLGSQQFAAPWTGVVQTFLVSPAGGVFFNCSGSLINPRAVLTASHCLFDLPSTSYGPNPGQSNILVGFGADTFPSIFAFIGGASARDGGAVLASDVIINPFVDLAQGAADRFPATPFDPFPSSDVSLVALSQPLDFLPNYGVLLSLVGPSSNVHVIQVGYGSFGSGLTGSTGINGLRRAGENVLGLLGSQNDFLRGIYNTTSTLFPNPSGDQLLYYTDFDNPGRTPANSCTRNGAAFGVDPDSIICPGFLGADVVSFAGTFLAPNPFIDYFAGDALPFEVGTAPGDSGSPLIADELLPGTPLVLGVLSGGFTFTAPVPEGFGDVSYYNPLALFAQFIVENNPAKYVSTIAGDGLWTDASRWVQTLDPNFFVINEAGAIVNGIPTLPNSGPFTEFPKEGSVVGVDINAVVPPGTTPVGSTPPPATDPATPALIAANTIGAVNGAATGVAVSLDASGAIASVPRDLDAGPPTGATGGGSFDFPNVPPLIGPGSTGFVPNNTDGDTTLVNAPAQYFYVTLNEVGATTLSDFDATIDQLTLFGDLFATTLNIAETGGLQSIIDVQNISGTLNVDGLLLTRTLENGAILSGDGVIGLFDELFDGDLSFVKSFDDITTGLVSLAAFEGPGLFLNDGVILPGAFDEIGELTLFGALDFDSEASVVVLDFSAAGRDELNLIGPTILGGTLFLSLNDGVVPDFSFGEELVNLFTVDVDAATPITAVAPEDVFAAAGAFDNVTAVLRSAGDFTFNGQFVDMLTNLDFAGAFLDGNLDLSTVVSFVPDTAAIVQSLFVNTLVLGDSDLTVTGELIGIPFSEELFSSAFLTDSFLTIAAGAFIDVDLLTLIESGATIAGDVFVGDLVVSGGDFDLSENGFVDVAARTSSQFGIASFDSAVVSIDGALFAEAISITNSVLSGTGALFAIGFGAGAASAGLSTLEVDPGIIFLDAAILPGGGGAIGELSFSGDVVFGPNNLLVIDVLGNTADQLTIDGNLALDGALALNLLAGPTPTFGSALTIATTSGGISGAFAETELDLPGVLFATPVINSAAGALALQVQAQTFLSAVGTSASAQQQGIAAALDSARASDLADFRPLFDLIDPIAIAQLPTLFDAFAPLPRLAATQIITAQGEATREVYLNRLTAVRNGQQFSVFGSIQHDQRLALADPDSGAIGPITDAPPIQAYAPQANGDAGGAGGGPRSAPGFGGFLTAGIVLADALVTPGAVETEFNSGFFSAGGDFTFGEWLTIGGGVDAAFGDADLAINTSVDVTSVLFGLYGSARKGPFYVDAYGRFGFIDVEMQRVIGIAGQSFSAAGVADGERRSQGVNLGADIKMGSTVFGPAIGYYRERIEFNSFTETGGPLALAYDNDVVTIDQFKFGFAARGTYNINGLTMTPRVNANFVHEPTEDGSESFLASFALDSTPFAFPVFPANADRSFFEIGAGIGVAMTKRFSVNLNFNRIIARDDLEFTSINGGLRFRW